MLLEELNFLQLVEEEDITDMGSRKGICHVVPILTMDGLMGEGVEAASRSRKWVQAGSQGRIRDVISIAARNWICQ